MNRSIFQCAIFIVVLFGISVEAHALGNAPPSTTLSSDKIKFGNPHFSGTGCNDQTAQFLVSPDQEEITLSYSEMVVDAGGTTRRRNQTKRCHTEIPISAPRGIQLIITSADYRGAATIAPENGGGGQLAIQYSLKDSKGLQGGMWKTKNFLNGFDDIFEWLGVETTFTSACGGAMTLITDSQIEIYANSKGSYSVLGLDTTDASSVGGRKLRVAWRACSFE